jgi:hypothetical protein
MRDFARFRCFRRSSGNARQPAQGPPFAAIGVAGSLSRLDSLPASM